MSNKRKAKDAREAGAQVWRIFHFEQRYELPEDMKICRKSGLAYTKRFVGANGGDEAVGYEQQMAMLCTGDGLDACLLEGLYGKLVNITAALSRAKRGYLLDAANQPLSSGQIARLLRIKAPTMRKLIARFESVRLLERVEMPELDYSKNEPPDKGAGENATGGGKKGGLQKHSGKVRKTPENSGKFRKEGRTLLESELEALNRNSNRNRNTNPKNNPRTSSSDPTNPTEGQAVTQPEDNAQGQAAAQGPSGIRTALTPTTTPPICPTSSDPGGPRVIPIHPPPPRPVHADDPTHISHAVAGIRRRCNPASRQAAERVYQALGGPKTEGTRQYAQDMGCLGAAFDRVVQSGLPPSVAAELWEGLIAEAQRLRRIYAKNGGYGAAKRVWFKPVLRDKLASRLPPIRDGPATSIG